MNQLIKWIHQSIDWLKEEDSELWFVENHLHTMSIGQSTHQDLVKTSSLRHIFFLRKKNGHSARFFETALRPDLIKLFIKN